MRWIACLENTAVQECIRMRWHLGYRYRKNNKTVFGIPDIIFKKYKIAIYVESEFLHGKDWENQKHRIKSNQEYWHKKIERNIQRDSKVNTYLTAQGWKVIRFWSKEVKKDFNSCIALIQKAILLKHNSTPL
jgi:DNA mismatch endonuclease (patch repair protein)